MPFVSLVVVVLFGSLMSIRSCGKNSAAPALLAGDQEDGILQRGLARGACCSGAEWSVEVGHQRVWRVGAAGGDGIGRRVDDRDKSAVAYGSVDAAAVGGGDGRHAESRRSWCVGKNRGAIGGWRSREGLRGSCGRQKRKYRRLHCQTDSIVDRNLRNHASGVGYGHVRTTRRV